MMNPSTTVHVSTRPKVKPVTEIARLNLKKGVNLKDEKLRQKLRTAQLAMQNYTGRTFYIMQSHHTNPVYQDDSILYIIGEWDSVEQHMNEWIPSQDNQDLLKHMKDDLSVQWLFHIDASHARLHFPENYSEEKEAAIRGDTIYSLERYVIKEGQKAAFDIAFKDKSHLYQEYITKVNGGRMGAGWICEKMDGRDGFCIVTPWRNTTEHVGFRWEDDSMNYAAIEEYIMENMIQTDHIKLLDL